MQREILFKAQRANGKGWIEGDLIKGKGKCHVFYNLPFELEIDSDFSLGDYEVIPETVCQYSGEKCDLNNLPLFKGDTGILKIEGIGEGKFEVVFYDGCFWFRVESRNTNMPFWQWKITKGIQVEKTGNIHDK